MGVSDDVVVGVALGVAVGAGVTVGSMATIGTLVGVRGGVSMATDGTAVWVGVGGVADGDSTLELHETRTNRPISLTQDAQMRYRTLRNLLGVGWEP